MFGALAEKHAKRLPNIGVLTAFDFIKLSDDWVKEICQ